MLVVGDRVVVAVGGRLVVGEPFGSGRIGVEVGSSGSGLVGFVGVRNRGCLCRAVP